MMIHHWMQCGNLFLGQYFWQQITQSHQTPTTSNDQYHPGTQHIWSKWGTPQNPIVTPENKIYGPCEFDS